MRSKPLFNHNYTLCVNEQNCTLGWKWARTTTLTTTTTTPVVVCNAAWVYIGFTVIVNLTFLLGSLQGPLTTTFPVENRQPPASLQALKGYLERNKNKPYVKRISDFHLLLLLSNYLDINTDVPQLTEAIHTQGPVPDGYQLIIESLASSF